MFAHQVIDDLAKSSAFNEEVGDGIESNYRAHIKMLVHKIKQSQHFHMHEETDLYDCCRSRFKKDRRLFMGENSINVRLPYRLCWFDFIRTPSSEDSARELVKDGMVLSTKRGILVEEIDPKTIMACVVNFMSDKKKWIPSPMNHLIRIGEVWEEGVLRKVIHINDKRGVTNRVVSGDSNFMSFPLFPDSEFPSDLRVKQMIEDADELASLNMALMLINSKNVGMEKQEASKNLNNKRVKLGRQPLFTYHTLVLKPVGKKQESIPKHLWNNRIHLQRGHFKTYTTDKPLFGHITGRFWWQPHVRGQNKNGVVMKDYSVEMGKHE